MSYSSCCACAPQTLCVFKLRLTTNGKHPGLNAHTQREKERGRDIYTYKDIKYHLKIDKTNVRHKVYTYKTCKYI